MRLSELRSLGAVSEERLKDVGIGTAEELEDVGAVEAYLRLKERYPRTTLNWLYALHCAISDMPWDMMAEETRRRLKAEAAEIGTGWFQEEG